MNNLQIKRVLVIALCVIVGLVIGFLALKGLIILLPPIIGGAIGAFIAFVLLKGPEEAIAGVKQTVNSIVKSAPARATDLASVLDGCLTLNQKLRLDEGVSADILKEAEEILDLVEELARALCEQYPSDELTFNVCRTGTYQLPRLFEPYFKLAPVDRKPAEEGVLTALRTIHKDMAEIREIFRSQGVDAARHRAKTVEMKYAGLGGAAAQA